MTWIRRAGLGPAFALVAVVAAWGCGDQSRAERGAPAGGPEGVKITVPQNDLDVTSDR